MHQAYDELERSKNNLKHYEEKERVHLESLKASKHNVATKERELEVFTFFSVIAKFLCSAVAY